jgi:hypothetical protein
MRKGNETPPARGRKNLRAKERNRGARKAKPRKKKKKKPHPKFEEVILH